MLRPNHALAAKSRYTTAVRCEKLLWLESHRPELAAARDKDALRRMAQGTEVGRRAREEH